MTRDLAEIDTIVVHCADVPDGRTTSVQEIDLWHKARGFRRSAADIRAFQRTLGFIGYHFVIYVDGTVVPCRAVTEVGAHVTGENRRSIGICLIGRSRYSPQQWAALKGKVVALQQQLADAREGRTARVVGHHVFNPAKTCPGFDVEDWLKGGCQPLTEHLL